LPIDKWVAYSIDGKENVTVAGTWYDIVPFWQVANITVPLPALSEGSHRLDVYAQSVPANYATPDSMTVFFSVNATAPNQNAISTSTLVAGLLVVAIVVVGLLVLFSKRRGKKQ
jgi:hypothetical protein